MILPERQSDTCAESDATQECERIGDSRHGRAGRATPGTASRTVPHDPIYVDLGLHSFHVRKVLSALKKPQVVGTDSM